MSNLAYGGVALIIGLAVWGIAIAMMVLSIIFMIKVPKKLEGIERQLQIANSMKAEQMHKEALGSSVPTNSNCNED